MRRGDGGAVAWRTLEGLRMVPLATTRSAFEARVLAARLGSEGIVWELRGGTADSVYPVGSVDVLVDEEDLDKARELLSIDLVEDTDDEVYDGGSDRSQWWVALVVLALLGLFIALRIFSL
jgi:hypothetical protein